jgi:HlyD family secretion protein
MANVFPSAPPFSHRPTRRSAWKRRSLQVAIVPLLACLTLGCGKSPESPEDEKHFAPVKAEPVHMERLGEWTELLGTTQPLPDRTARVSASVEGHVVSLLEGRNGSAEGQRVQAGQVIARLDDRVPRANRAKLAAQIDELIEQKSQAGYVVELATVEVKRLEELRQGSGAGVPLVSRVDMEKTRIALQDARSKERAVAAKEAVLRADLKALDAQLDFYTLKAPIAGTLGLLQAVSGQTLAPGASVAEVVDLDEIDALCFAPPNAARRLVVGQTARLAGEDKLAGKVVFISVQAQAETGNVAVKVRFPNKDLALRANSVVRVLVQTHADKDRLVVKEVALMEDQQPPAIVVVRDLETKDHDGKPEKVGKAVKLEVQVGVRDREKGLVEVLGVAAADKKYKTEKFILKDLLVVTEGGHGLHDGDTVKLDEEEEHEKE